ncbi:MAG: hypothetical protein IJ049_03900 [Oscillospiraceae bacterium]|nr:hypothetical protein [Oscillospiraceae bacterium]
MGCFANGAGKTPIGECDALLDTDFGGSHHGMYCPFYKPLEQRQKELQEIERKLGGKKYEQPGPDKEQQQVTQAKEQLAQLAR